MTTGVADDRVVSKSTRRKEQGLAALFLVPSLIVFGVFVFYPLINNVILGFYRTAPFPGLPDTYVGEEGTGWIDHWAISQGKIPQGAPPFPQWVIDRTKELVVYSVLSTIPRFT